MVGLYFVKSKLRYRILSLLIHPKDLELALAVLYMAGYSTVEHKRNKSGIWLHTQIPFELNPEPILKDLSQFQTADTHRKIFISLRYHTVFEGNWTTLYKKYLKPFTLYSTQGMPVIKIDPRGKSSSKINADTLYIKPGLAFGTGTHPTTHMAAQLLCETLEFKKNARVLDLGCGTGILAMVAKKRGAFEVVGIDNDPIALEVAGKNFKENKLRSIHLAETIPRKKFQIIVANILLGILLELRNKIVSSLSKQGLLILSGLLYKDCAEIIKAYQKAGLVLIERRNQKGWSVLLFQKK